jgi:hypothetical protein
MKKNILILISAFLFFLCSGDSEPFINAAGKIHFSRILPIPSVSPSVSATVR